MESRLTTDGQTKIETVGLGLKERSQFETEVAHSGRYLNFVTKAFATGVFRSLFGF